MLYKTAVSILSIYDIVPALDAQGKPIRVVPGSKAGAVAKYETAFLVGIL